MPDLDHPGVLTDGVVELRRWQDGDVDAVRAARAVPHDEALEWIRRQQARPSTVGVSFAVARVAQTALGYIGLIRRPRVELGVTRAIDDEELGFRAHQHVAGIGYWTTPGAQGHGFATRAAVLISRWGLQAGGLIRIEALLDPLNIASRRVVEKVGFRPEGQLRSYLELDGRATDALVYSLLAGDISPPD